MMIRAMAKRYVNPSILGTVDQVIVYLRRADEKVNRIFPGNDAGIQKSDLLLRHRIHFSGLEEVGRADSNWPEFSKSGQNPVGYVAV
jgi:hypothetical protein